MRNRPTQLVTLTLILICLFNSTVSAQRRRATRRPSAQRTLFVTLTVKQKAEIADVLEKARALEITYNYRPKEYADAAFDVSSGSGKVEDTLPEGVLKNLMLDMWSAWRAAGFMYGTCLPSYKGSFHRYIEAGVAEASLTGKTDVADPIPEIVRQYNLQNMNPCQAQREMFNYGRIITMRVKAVLDGSPTARGEYIPRPAADTTPANPTDSVGRSGAGTTLDQVERQAQQLSGQLDELADGSNAGGSKSSEGGGDEGWAFPKQGMSGRYSEDIKGMIYDLGDAIFAGRMKLDTNQGPLSIALVVFGVPVPRDKMSDGDLALVVASKVASLPERVSDTVMERSDSGEYRFRTTGGKVIGVAIAYDRKTAMARFLSDQ